MQLWAAEELKTVRMGDARLNKRLVTVVEALSAQPTASVPQAAGNWPATKATYRFWDSERVTPEAIRAAHRDATVGRLASLSRVLAIQDTSEFDFSHHPGTKGLGPIGVPSRVGLKLHSALAVSLEGVPLGIVHQQVWVRDPEDVGKAKRRRQLAIEEKESQRWLSGLDGTMAAIPQGVAVITVGDSEADIFELFAKERRAGAELLIRATHNRVVSDEERYLWAAVRRMVPSGELTVELRRREELPARTAVLTVRHGTVEIHPPRNHKERSRMKPVKLQVVLVEEDNPPLGVEAICWLLVTTLAVGTLEEAVQCVRWYTYRWLVERYHYVLKSGCRLEELQLESAERIERALATYATMAWRLLWLTYEARRHPEASCEVALEVHEWQALYCTKHKVGTPPSEAPTMRDAVRWIAQLGGFLGRKGDGEPGVKTIWRGLRRLHDIASTWQLAHPGVIPDPRVLVTYG